MKTTQINSIKKTWLLTAFVFLVAVISGLAIMTPGALAERGTLLGDCVHMDNENSRNNCLYQLQAGANEHCAGEADQAQCMREYMSGASSVSGGPGGDGGAMLDEDADCTGEDELTAENCGIVYYLTMFINILSSVVGIVVVIMIVWGSIQYISSRDNPQQTSQAKSHIYNALLALVIYIFSIAFLNWLVPGGVL